MKQLYRTILMIFAAGASVMSCDIEKKFDTTIPQYPLTKLISSATATAGEETVNGIVDNDKHTVEFVFNDTEDFSAIEMKFNYPSRVIRKENAAADTTADLNGGRKYTLVLNNLEEDFTYEVSAYRASVVKVDRTQCSVITGLDGDADPATMETLKQGKYGASAECLFDGLWSTKKNDWASYGYRSFGWAMKSLQGSDGKTFGNAYTVDFGSSMRVAKMRFWPYWPYTRTDAAQFEIYAWPLEGEPSGSWASWQLIGTVDVSDRWEATNALGDGETNAYLSEGIVVDFVYGDVPSARYYRVKLIKNFMQVYKDKIEKYWNDVANVNAYSVAELEVWKYNIDE